MAIESVNTIEIRIIETLDAPFAETLQAFVDNLQQAPMCCDYALTKSSREPGLWILTGYWESETQMTESFESAAMMQLIDCLIVLGASLSFGSFICLPAIADGD